MPIHLEKSDGVLILWTIVGSFLFTRALITEGVPLPVKIGTSIIPIAGAIFIIKITRARCKSSEHQHRYSINSTEDSVFEVFNERHENFSVNQNHAESSATVDISRTINRTKSLPIYSPPPAYSAAIAMFFPSEQLQVVKQ